MRAIMILAPLFLWLLPVPASADTPKPDEERYTFQVEGHAITTEVRSLRGTPETPEPGDLLCTRRFCLTLGEEQGHQFSVSPDEGKVYFLPHDGNERLVGVIVTRTYVDGEKVIHNPLEQLSPKEINGLWGISLDAWPEGVTEKLQHIDPDRSCVTVRQDTRQGERNSLPPLRADIRYLNVDENSSECIEDYSALSGFKRLLYFSAGWEIKHEYWGALAGNPNLRYLDLGYSEVETTQGLESLPELRHLRCRTSELHPGISKLSKLRRLDLSHSEVGDLTPLGGLKQLEVLDAGHTSAEKLPLEGLPHLKYLDISSTAVTDLTALSRYGSIETVLANQTPVEKLPQEPLASLKKLSIMSTRLTDAAAATFAEANPQCTVDFRWTATFRNTVAEAARVRVRTGGTCHRDPDAERTIFEVAGKDEVLKFVKLIEIDEEQSGFHCMCCGAPTFELYRGDHLLAMVGFHHGRSLRWSEGWPDDGMLTPASGDAITRWLADHGLTGPLEERQKEKRREAALTGIWDRYFEILPEPIAQVLEEEITPDDLAAAIEKAVPNDVERAVLYLRLLGTGHPSWHHLFGLGRLASKQLEKSDDSALLSALDWAMSTPDGASGAARWVLYENEPDSASELPSPLLKTIGKQGLRDPRPYNRIYTVRVLGEINNSLAVNLLREVLANPFPALELPEVFETEPGGMVVYRGGGDALPEGCSIQAYAALKLAMLDDRQSLPAILELQKNANDVDAEVLTRAIEVLQRESGGPKE